MRQWKVDSRILCRQHLVAEHNEHHMFLGTLRKKISISGYIKNNLIEPKSLKIRHDYLVTEMLNRSYKHHTPLDFKIEDIMHLPELELNYILDGDRSFNELMIKCNECRNRAIILINDYKMIETDSGMLNIYNDLLNQIGDIKT